MIEQVYSSIRPELRRRVLLRGSAFSLIGAVLVVISGIYLPPFWMQYFGFPLLILGILLIAYGMVPYRRLTQLETQPHELRVTEGTSLHYLIRGQPVLSIPLEAIDRLSFCDEEVDRYGIALDLKPGGSQKVSLRRKGEPLSTYIARMRKRYACDLFFPYFTLRSYRELQKALTH